MRLTRTFILQAQGGWAGIDGILQGVPIEGGQQVAPGANLAPMANPARLKATIRTTQTQAIADRKDSAFDRGEETRARL